MKAIHFSITILAALVFSGLLSQASAQGAREILETSARLPKFPLIGDKAPEFEAQTTEGKVEFPADYAGKWVILFSHPADFTPVCTSEFVVFASLAGEFEKLNAELLGLSIGEVERHRQWKRSIRDNIEYLGIKNQEIPFPIIADSDQEVAWRYGMLHPAVSETRTVRAVFVIDPKGVIRAISYYPPEVGRNVSELKRLLISIQTADKHRVATPANWQPGEDVLVGSDDAKDDGKTNCQEAFFCLRPLDESQLSLP